MTQELIGFGEISPEQLDEIAFIQYKNMSIYKGKEQKWELSPSNKTIFIVQYDNGKEIGRKGWRVSSCLFFNEYYD